MKNKVFIKTLSVLCALILLSGAAQASALVLNYAEKVPQPGLEVPISDELKVTDGSVVLEAEKMTIGNGAGTISLDAASEGVAVNLNSTKWYDTDLQEADLYSKIYLDENETPGRYKLWCRVYTLTTETASIFIDNNTGVYAAKWFSEAIDRVFRWTSVDIYLEHGENYVAIKRRGSTVIDKLIITNNTIFTPKGKDDVPVYMTPEEMEAEWRTYWQEPEIKPIAGHPRLYLTPEFIPEFKENLKDPSLSSLYSRYKGYAYEDIDCKLDTSKANNHDTTPLTKIMSRALVWVLGEETDIKHAQKTIAHMNDYLDTYRTPDDGADITRSRGNVLLTAAIVYDWCYDALTQEQKTQLYEKMLVVVASKEIGWPPTKMSSISSHAGEQEIFRDMLGAGIAIYDEYPLLYDLAAGRMFERMVPARIWLNGTGRFLNGNDYAECRYYSEVWADITMQRMGYPSIYGDIAGSTIGWMLRARMPDGRKMSVGDMYSLNRTATEDYYVDYPLAIDIAANLYKDPYLKAESLRVQGLQAHNIYLGFFTMLFTDPSVKPMSWDGWDLAKYSSYPLSGLLARTSWQEGFEADTAAAFMDMHEVFLGDHQHKYTGDFQLYYKGMLAMNTGTYNYSNAHNEGYSHRGISANTLLVQDPLEKFVPSWGSVPVQNDGGQRFPYVDDEGKTKGAYVLELDELNLDENNVVQNEDLIVSEDVQHYIGPNEATPEFSYISGDLTKAYTSKVSDYRRGMVFLDLFNDDYPAALIVYDYVETSNKDFKKTWLLHSHSRPQVAGNTTTITKTDGGHDGKLVNKTLIPARANTEIKVTGSESGSEIFTINGHNYGFTLNAYGAGHFRTSISPKSAAKEDKFLNAMYVTDASRNLPELPMTLERGTGYVGVTVADRLVTFSNEGKLITNDTSVSVRSNGYSTVSCLMTGFDAGLWTIAGNGFSVTVMSKEGENCLYFKAAPGRYTIKRAAEGAAATEITYEKTQKRAKGDFMVWRQVEGRTDRSGTFMYLEKPARLVDGVPYIAVETLGQFGVSVARNGDLAALSAGENNISLTAGTAVYTLNEETKEAVNPPLVIDGTLYIAPTGYGSDLGYKFSYRALPQILYASK